MSHRTSSSSTQNFRQDYRVNPTPAQSSQYREHQQAYQQMPSGTYDRLRASGDVLDSKTKVYKERKEERLDVERRTEAARMERRDRTDPDIQAGKCLHESPSNKDTDFDNHVSPQREEP